MEILFKGRRVFLTGGSRGIGKKIRETFESAGAQVTAPARCELDLMQRGAVRQYLDANPGLDPDIFVHCAGMNEPAGIREVSQEMMDRVFQVNCFSAVELVSGFAGGMAERGWGRIIFISSLYSLISKEGRVAYSSSKSALNGVIRTLALELAPGNVLVNGIAPGYVLTDMTYKNLSPQEIRDIRAGIPTGRFQKEKEIADLAAFLCSNLNESITGQILTVDGGFTCR